MISITRMKPKNFHTIYLQNPPKLPHTQIPKSNTWWSIGSKIIYDLQNQAKNGARKIKEKKVSLIGNVEGNFRNLVVERTMTNLRFKNQNKHPKPLKIRNWIFFFCKCCGRFDWFSLGKTPVVEKIETSSLKNEIQG